MKVVPVIVIPEEILPGVVEVYCPWCGRNKIGIEPLSNDAFVCHRCGQEFIVDEVKMPDAPQGDSGAF